MTRTSFFSDKIGLSSDWPQNVGNAKSADIGGLLKWAESHFEAAEKLLSEPTFQLGSAFYIGPVLNNVGLATELTLKTLIRGGGSDQSLVKRLGHNTYKCYQHAVSFFDETKFIEFHFLNTQDIKTPSEIRDRLVEKGEDDPEARWRIYFNHLRLLDTVYGHPFKTRYVEPGPVTLPDAQIILIGTKLLLVSMRERVNSR